MIGPDMLAAGAIAGAGTPTWLIILVVLLGGGGAGVFVNAFANRRKNSADTVKAIEEAAGGVVARVEGDNERLRQENKAQAEKLEARAKAAEDRAEEIAIRTERREAEFRRRIARLEHRMAEEERFRQAHVVWDWQAISELRRAGIALPDPPPLHPPFEDESPAQAAWTVTDSGDDENPASPTTEGATS